MKKFEIGKEYFDTSACDHNCVFTIKIVKRTDKTVTFERNGKTRRTKLFSDERGEISLCWKLFFTKRPNYDMLCQNVSPGGAPAGLVLGQRRVSRGASARPSPSGRAKKQERWNFP